MTSKSYHRGSCASCIGVGWQSAAFLNTHPVITMSIWYKACWIRHPNTHTHTHTHTSPTLTPKLCVCLKHPSGSVSTNKINSTTTVILFHQFFLVIKYYFFHHLFWVLLLTIIPTDWILEFYAQSAANIVSPNQCEKSHQITSKSQRQLQTSYLGETQFTKSW